MNRSEFDGKSMVTETKDDQKFPMTKSGKVIVEQTLASEETKKSKRAGL